MTDRIHALTVVLDRPIREDDIQPTIEAIKQLRGVVEVVPSVADIDTYAAEERAIRHLTSEILNLVKGWHRG
jgi:hypothetical protein